MRVLLFAVFVMLWFGAGCSDNFENNYTSIPTIPESSGAQNTVLAIELEHRFDNDNVLVYLDGHKLLSANITTDYTISAAWLSGPFDYPVGNHAVAVSIADNFAFAVYEFLLTDTLTIRVTYDPDKKEFHFFEQPGLFLERD